MMRRLVNPIVCAVTLSALAIAVCGDSGRAQAAAGESAVGPLLRFTGSISLPKVSGRIDHLAFDPLTSRLFIAALGNNTVEVVDTLKRSHLRSIPNFHEPQGIAAVPYLKSVAVANGESGTLQLLDDETFAARGTSAIGSDADNVRYDADSKTLYVTYEGGIAAVNPSSGVVVRRIAIGGHPESFQLQRNGSLLFANLPEAAQIVVADDGLCPHGYCAGGEEAAGFACRDGDPLRLVTVDAWSADAAGF